MFLFFVGPVIYEMKVPTTSTVSTPMGLIQWNDKRYKGNTSDSSRYSGTMKSKVCLLLSFSALHSEVQAPNLCGTKRPAATDICEPSEIQPEIKAPAAMPAIAPVVLLRGTSIPSVKTPNVVPAAMADSEVATTKIPPSFSITNKRIIAMTPRIRMLPFTIKAAALSVGSPWKHPLYMSSRMTAAVEFKTTDKELHKEVYVTHCN